MTPATARRTDPDTSHLAARDMERSGRAAAHREICLAAVRAHPGLTSAEVARRTGLERHAAARRLPELMAAGLIRQGEKRMCQVCGHRSVMWWPKTNDTRQTNMEFFHCSRCNCPECEATDNEE